MVGGLAGLGLLLMYWSRALLTLAWALVLGEGHECRAEQGLSWLTVVECLVTSVGQELDRGRQPCCVIQCKARCPLTNSWLMMSSTTDA